MKRPANSFYSLLRYAGVGVALLAVAGWARADDMALQGLNREVTAQAVLDGHQHLVKALGALWGLSELLLALFKRSKSNATSKDRHSLEIIWVVHLLAIALAVAAANVLKACALPRPDLFRGIGTSIFLTGLVVRWYAILYLGRFFTPNVAIAADHKIIDTGPYRFIRHPSYTGGLMMVLGFGLCLSNWASLAILFLPCLTVILWRIRIEEEALLGALGEAYGEYRKRTKRLVPGGW